VAVRRVLDLLALVALVLAGWIGEEHPPSRGGGDALLFLGACAAGTAAGYRLASAAFRWGRRRRGQDPEPGPPSPARFLAKFVGFWVKLLIGFTFWALVLQFFKRI
jgi:hypothetical protein